MIKDVCKDRIHFLNTGHSDCMILESDGHFAMVDAGEDTDFPIEKPHLDLKGYEDDVVNYLLKHCKGKDGKVTLDFIVATHAHSDHIGGFDTVILHPDIVVKKAYIRLYQPQNVFVMERKSWDNQEVYDQMIDALLERNVPICHNFNNVSFRFGSFKITLTHGENKHRVLKFGENINSVVTILQKKNMKALLAGDMNYKANDEKRVANMVGKVDLLKVGHHGYVFSTSHYFAKKLSPKYSIVTNNKKCIYPDVYFNLTKVAHSKIYATADENGIIADFKDDGTLELHSNIM